MTQNPFYESEAPGPNAYPATPPRKNNTTLIIILVIIGVLLLCCCCLAVFGTIWYINEGQYYAPPPALTHVFTPILAIL